MDAEARALQTQQFDAPSGELRYLDPASLRFQRQGAVVHLTVDDRCSWYKVSIVRAFPYSHPSRHLSILDATEKEIGLIAEPDRLDAASREIVDAELARRYRLPLISRVWEIKERFGTQDWEVQTDRGPCRFTTRDLFDNARLAADGRIVVTDVDGNRYVLADDARLDPQSRRLLDVHL